MNLRAIARSLGPIDLRSVWRDSMLSWMAFMPFVIGIVLRLGLPPLQSRLLELSGFDLEPYYPLILAVYVVLMTPMLFGTVVGFLLLDEKDNDTLTALQVSPLPMTTYAGYRVLLPMVFSFILTFLVYPLVKLVPIPLRDLFLMALVAAPAGPALALFIASFADNKVQGFALLKAMGAVLILPLVAYFITDWWGILFGVLPTYWPVKVYWLLQAGQGGVWLYAVVGILYQLLLNALLLRRFVRGLYR